MISKNKTKKVFTKIETVFFGQIEVISKKTKKKKKVFSEIEIVISEKKRKGGLRAHAENLKGLKLPKQYKIAQNFDVKLPLKYEIAPNFNAKLLK